MKVRYMGWIVAAALIAAAITTGFQGSTTKLGIIDASKVLNDSEYVKTQADGLKALVQARQDMVQFVQSYPTFTVQQATSFHDLSLKPVPTAADTAAITKIKTDVQASNKRLKELQTKANPTAAEQTELNQLSQEVQTTSDMLQRWTQDAQTEIDGKRQDLQKDGRDKVKDAIKQVAKDQGYTVVFISDFAPYGANDLTDPVLKAMNSKK